MVIHRYARAIVRSADHREITGVIAKASRHISIFLRERCDAYEPAHAYNCALYVACKNKNVVVPIFFYRLSYLTFYVQCSCDKATRIDEAFSAANINKIFFTAPYKIRLAFARRMRYRSR